jgi:UDP-glucuronate 4-epimerase
MPVSQRVVHLAAQAGVRHSLIENPQAYARFQPHRLRPCARGLPAQRRRTFRLRLVELGLRLQYPSLPFRRLGQSVDHPVSLYAATKKANELHGPFLQPISTGLPTTGLRFFTVYGPWGRPDMSHL